jgi:serine/threonine-protein kinase
MLATGRDDRRGANGREKNGKNGARNGKSGAGTRFEVLGRAGEGTLWIVYRVRERATGQVLALKALKGAFNRHPRFPVALLDSCSRWCNLEDPHLAGLREVGHEDDTLFFTGDWLPGGTLEARLGRAMSRDEIISVLRSAAAALEFLHERQLTHGDIRPRQLLFDAGGHLKLTDGGVAEAFANAGLALADVQPDAAWYLAPERTQGASLAPPADIYALGVLLYRMLAGRVPFDGPSPVAIALRHRSDAPLPPSQLNPRCPADLEQLALRLLEKDPGRRANASAILRHLDQIAPIAASATAAAVAAAANNEPITPGGSAASVPVAAAAGADSDIQVNVPRRRPLSPIVEETLEAQKKEELQLDRETLRRRHKRREFWGMLGAFVWLILFAGAFGGMFYGAYYYWLQESPQTVRVPNYLGLEQEEAKQRLAKAGLVMRVGRETYDAKKPEGTVVTGQPEPGRLVRARREVTVTISQGQAPITMYDFSELPLAQARQIIAQHAMRLGPVVEQFHDKVPRGFICGQYPDAGEPFRRSEPITLIVSRGPQPSEIDGTNGDIPPLDAATSDPNSAPIDEAVPFEPSPATNSGAAVSRTALIRVQIPADGGAQSVRIVVRDAGGEREAYAKTHSPGDEVEERVTVRRAQGAKALVRVYVGQSLIKEERF